MIDCHTHFFSRAFFETLASQAVGDEADLFARVRDKTGLEIPDADHKLHADKWLTQMSSHGVDHMVTFASLPEEMPALAEALEVSDHLSGMCVINPMAKTALTFLDSLSEKKFKGVLLFPVMHGYHVSDRELDSFFEKCQSLSMICLVHFGLLQIKIRDVLGLPRTFDLRFGNPLDLLVTANRFSETSFVIPHFGCGFFRETLMLGSQCDNVFVDTSSSNNWMQTQVESLTLADVFKKTHHVFGAKRILFGTDSSIFPRGWRKDIFEGQQKAMNEAKIPSQDQQCIFHENSAALFSISSQAIEGSS